MTKAGKRLIRSAKQARASIRNPYNDGYTHEAFHAAHIVCGMWDSHVTGTRCGDQFPDVKEAAEKAAEALHQVYQLIGQKFANER